MPAPAPQSFLEEATFCCDNFADTSVVTMATVTSFFAFARETKACNAFPSFDHYFSCILRGRPTRFGDASLPSVWTCPDTVVRSRSKRSAISVIGLPCLYQRFISSSSKPQTCFHVQADMAPFVSGCRRVAKLDRPGDRFSAGNLNLRNLASATQAIP